MSDKIIRAQEQTAIIQENFNLVVNSGPTGVIAATTPVNYDLPTRTVSIDIADDTQDGALSYKDWNTFNAKQDALGYTPLNPSNNLSDLLDKAQARVNLYLGSAALQNTTAFDAFGSSALVQSNLNVHKSDTSNPHLVDQTQVGLSNVDNTTDLLKPISEATQNALNLKQDLLPSQLGQEGKFLTTDGAFTSWHEVTPPVWGAISGDIDTQIDLLNKFTLKENALPSQIGQTGKFLKTDGTNKSWASAITQTTWGAISGELANQLDLTEVLNNKITNNVAITGATKTKITYDSKGLVTSGANATTADIIEGTNLYYTDDRVSDNAAVALNTAKITNQTHTGEVTGSTILTLDKTSISNKTYLSVAVDDYILISDTSDSSNLKKTKVQDVLALQPSSSASGLDTYVQFNDTGVFGSDSKFTYNKTTSILSAEIFKIKSSGPTIKTGGNNTEVWIGNNAGSGVTTGATSSVFFGTSAGSGATGALYANFFGANAGKDATNAINFNCFGVNSGSGAANASNSNFLGSFSGLNATNATNSNFFGANAGNGASQSGGANFFGLQAGKDAVNASYSNFFGSLAGKEATNATSSNFFGANAGNGATGASYSNFFGDSAGRSAATASYSNFFGSSAGSSATNALNSNFFGTNAGSGATGALYSNFFGTNAGSGATGASYSNFFGANAGNNAPNAKNCIFIGYNCAANDTIDTTTVANDWGLCIGPYSGTGGFKNSVAIGKGAKNSEIRQINLGNVIYATGIYNATTQSSTPITGGKVGVGTNSPQAELDVVGAITTDAGTNKWKFKGLTTAHSHLDESQYITINLNGTDYKLALAIAE